MPPHVLLRKTVDFAAKVVTGTAAPDEDVEVSPAAKYVRLLM